MAEKIITEYDVQTSKAVQNLQGVINQYESIETASAKASATGAKGINQVAASAQAATPKFNALGNSINQLSRELPAFTNSAQTGFLAISNNLPILIDSIGQLRAENERLAASGQKGVPIYKQLASAFFSFNTLISVGITLLTVYGKEIGNFIASIFKGKEAFDSAKASLDAINSAYDSKELKSAVRGLIDLRASVEQAREGYVSKESVIKKYNETLGVAFGKVTSLDEAEKGIIDNTSAYVDAIVKREAANKIAAEAAETLIQLRKAELKSEADFVSGFTGFRDLVAIGQQKSDKELERLAKERKARDEKAKQDEINRLKKQLDSQLSLLNGFNASADQTLKDGGKGSEAIKTAFELLNEEIAKTKLQIRNGVIAGSSIQADLDKLEKLETQLRVIETTIERVKSGVVPGSADITQTLVPLDLKQVEQTADNVKKELNDINKTVVDNAKKSIKANEENAKAWEEYEKEKTEATREATKEREMLEQMAVQGGFRLASQLESEIFNLKRNNLEAETQFQLDALQTQLDKKQITEEQFEAQRKQLLNDQNQKQREFDLAQIKVQTALSIVRTLAEFGFTPAGAIAAALAAAEGAVQYAFASAQPLPQFAQGTERVTGGVKGKDSVHALLMPDEAVIKAKENMNRPGLAKAWNAGKLDEFITMQYIKPAIEQVNRKWEREINMNQTNQFIRKDNFNDKNIVGKLDVIARKLTSPKQERTRVVRGNNRLWN